MRSLKERTLGARASDFFGGLPMGLGLIEALLIADKAVVIGAMLVALVILGVLLGAAQLYFSPKQELVNRWYRAAYQLGWIVSLSLGAIIIGAIVAWGISGANPNALPPVSAVLLLIAQVGFPVDFLLVVGLSAIGWLAQGTKETNEWARSWGRTHAAPAARPTQEHPSAE